MHSFSAICIAGDAKKWNKTKLISYGLSSLSLLADYKQTSDIAEWNRTYGAQISQIIAACFDKEEEVEIIPGVPEYTQKRNRASACQHYHEWYIEEAHSEKNSIMGFAAHQHEVDEYFLGVWVLLGLGTWYLDTDYAVTLNGSVFLIEVDAIKGNITAGWEIGF